MKLENPETIEKRKMNLLRLKVHSIQYVEAQYSLNTSSEHLREEINASKNSITTKVKGSVGCMISYGFVELT